MFSCAVCSIMFTGVYPEVIVATPCGHVFHMKCIQMCLHKSKCPFCSSHIDKSRLIQLYFQIDKNWKETATSLKSKANSSVINLDETLNETLRINDSDSLNNISLVKNNPNDSVIEDTDLLFRGDMHLRRPLISSSKTLLTTSLSGLLLAPVVKNLLSVFSDIIPNSVVKMRLLVSENKLLQMAIEEDFTNIIIINMQLGYPVGLYLIDFLKNTKTSVMLTSYECLDYEKLAYKIKAPPLAIKNIGKLNEFQERIVHFFSVIFQMRSKQVNEEEINITCNHSLIEFSYNLAGLHFYMISPSSNNNDITKEITF